MVRNAIQCKTVQDHARQTDYNDIQVKMQFIEHKYKVPNNIHCYQAHSKDQGISKCSHCTLEVSCAWDIAET